MVAGRPQHCVVHTHCDLVPHCACLGQGLCLLLLHCPPDPPSAALIPGPGGCV